METPADTPAEETRLMRAAQGDLRHFSPIYDRYFPRIYAYCLRRVGNVQEAEDLTSQVFTRAMVHIETYRGGFVAAWLFSIARNAIATYSAGRRAELSIDEIPIELEGESPNLTEDIVQAEEQAVLGQIVAQLPPDQQDLLRWRLVEGLTSEKIAARSGKTAVAVRVTLHRVFRRLYADYQRRMAGSAHD
jgi:RNA polymerase sigma-70 factor (ECF subfamily)